MIDIRINEPGAGEWIMHQAGGVFTPKQDNSFSSHRGSHILGGFVLTYFIGGSIIVHLAAQDKRWCSRELLWLVFHYAFEQLGCYKVLSPLASDELKIINMARRMGGVVEAVVQDAYAPGRHMVIMGMTKEACPWLKYRPKIWFSRNREAA